MQLKDSSLMFVSLRVAIPLQYNSAHGLLAIKHLSTIKKNVLTSASNYGCLTFVL